MQSNKLNRFSRQVSDSYYVMYINGHWIHFNYDVEIDRWIVFSRTLPLNSEHMNLNKAKKKTRIKLNEMKILWE